MTEPGVPESLKSDGPGENKIAELVARAKRGERPKYLYFWGHAPRKDGRIGASCLSQWWEAPFTVNGVRYATAEHWMMAAKARLFGDAEAERAVLAARSPAAAKKAGRLVRGFDEAIWRRERYGIVVDGSVHKFAAHDDLCAFLVGTGDRILVEASPLDRVWGIGLARDDERAQDPARWRGLNLLGFALMDARAELRAELRALADYRERQRRGEERGVPQDEAYRRVFGEPPGQQPAPG